MIDKTPSQTLARVMEVAATWKWAIRTAWVPAGGVEMYFGGMESHKVVAWKSILRNWNENVVCSDAQVLCW